MDQRIEIIQNDNFKEITTEYIKESALVYSKIIFLKQIELNYELISMDLCAINFIKVLVNDDLLTEDGDLISLSEKGIELLKRLSNNIIVKQITSDGVIKQNPVEEWIQEWIDLWKDDTGKFFKSPSNDGVRSLGCTKTDALSNMNLFLVKYKNSLQVEDPKSLIMDATREYIERFRRNNFAYCHKSNYFIIKQDKFKKHKSMLAEECERVLEIGLFPEESDPFIKTVNK